MASSSERAWAAPEEAAGSGSGVRGVAGAGGGSPTDGDLPGSVGDSGSPGVARGGGRSARGGGRPPTPGGAWIRDDRAASAAGGRTEAQPIGRTASTVSPSKWPGQQHHAVERVADVICWLVVQTRAQFLRLVNWVSGYNPGRHFVKAGGATKPGRRPRDLLRQ